MISFNGTWQSEISKELISITGPKNGDEYILEHNWTEDHYKSKEKIEIFISNGNHARLLKSEKFRSNDIWILSETKIKLDDIIYIKKYEYRK